MNGEKGVSRVASTKAGDTITFEFRDHPDGSQPGSIDVSHKGPCAVYMKKVDNAAADNNANGPGWFRIMSDGYDNSTQKWCTEKMNPNNGHLAATIPKDLAPGYYLMRPELLALHAAAKTPPDPQFYLGCAQIFLTSDGSSKPADTVSIPGYVDLTTPAMTYNVWSVPLKLPFPDFGPKVYTGNSKRKLRARAGMTQTIGLKPAGCVMESVNWCGFLPPKYTDETSCYSVSAAFKNWFRDCTHYNSKSSANCSTQTQDCYNSAGPTGSKNCKNWEAYCTDIRNGCGSGQTSGPPSIDSHSPAPPAKLDSEKVVYMSNVPVPNNVVSQSSASAPQSITATPATQYSAPAAAVPAGAAVTAGAGAGNESIDTCGTNGGQKCATGMCCSSHG